MSRLVQLSTLRDRVITLCDLPATLDTTTSPTAAQILELLQTSTSLLSGLIREFPQAQLHFAESSTISTIADVAFISLPTAASTLLRLSWLKDSDTEVPIQLASLDTMQDRPTADWASQTPCYRVVGSTIEFYPTPTAAYDVRAYYSTGLYPATIASYVHCQDGWDQWIVYQTCILVRMRQQRAAPEFDMALAQLTQSLRAQFRRDNWGIQTVRDVRGSCTDATTPLIWRR